MIKIRKKRGFTIVELMVGIVVSSILALTAGTMLVFISLSWRRGTDSTELQRDATFAMDMFSRAIRPGHTSYIQASGSTLIAGAKSFYLSGTSLWYDPDMGTTGDEVEIIKDKVSSLTFTKDPTAHSVDINMVLQDSPDSITLNAEITYRI
ncbi:MAG: type II secretion system protein [Candidatus Omnitrophica bacterium]|nr:type II secretion system protein [Candidatus Omnitrophota bacterium]